MRDVADDAEWTALIPLKSAQLAKSRLAGVNQQCGVSPEHLAVAFALDVMAACGHCELIDRVAVVGNKLPAEIDTPAVDVIAEPPGLTGLNDALTFAISRCRSTHAAGIIIVTGDLPSLKAPDLTTVINSADDSRPSFVRDHTGFGTSMLVIPTGTAVNPRFGFDSGNRHAAMGYQDITGYATTRARLDVDTPADLRAVTDLGVGAATHSLLFP